MWIVLDTIKLKVSHHKCRLFIQTLNHVSPVWTYISPSLLSVLPIRLGVH